MVPQESKAKKWDIKTTASGLVLPMWRVVNPMMEEQLDTMKEQVRLGDEGGTPV
jgi:hypothetical protein